MKFTDRQKRILHAKLKPWREFTQCVGYLTPVEILYLVRIGCKPEANWKVEQAENQVKIGEIYGTWFYFEPTDEVLAKLREKYPEFKRHGNCRACSQ